MAGVDALEIAVICQRDDLDAGTVGNVDHQRVRTSQTVNLVDMLAHNISALLRVGDDTSVAALKGSHVKVVSHVRAAVDVQLQRGIDGVGDLLNGRSHAVRAIRAVHHVQKISDVGLLTVVALHQIDKQRTVGVVISRCRVIITGERVGVDVVEEGPVGVVGNEVPLALHAVDVRIVLALGCEILEHAVVVLRPVAVIDVSHGGVHPQIGVDVKHVAKQRVVVVVGQVQRLAPFDHLLIIL